MSDNETNGDGSTLKELRETRERAERMNWSTDRIEDELASREERQDILLRRQRLSDLASDPDAPPATRETAEREAAEIDELLAAPLEAEAAEKRETAQTLRTQVENLAHQQGWEETTERAEARAETLEAEAEALEAKAAGEAGAEAMSTAADPATSDSEPEPTPSRWEVDVEAAVERYRENHPDGPLVVEADSIEELPEVLSEYAETFEARGETDRAKGQRGMARIFEAHREGVGTIELQPEEKPSWAREGEEAQPVRP